MTDWNDQSAQQVIMIQLVKGKMRGDSGKGDTGKLKFIATAPAHVAECSGIADQHDRQTDCCAHDNSDDDDNNKKKNDNNNNNNY